MSYGIDVWTDVERLCGLWKYQVRRIFDVGANTGQTAALLLKRFPNASVDSFEPHPETFTRLKQHLGSCDRFRAHDVALSDRTGPGDFYEYRNSLINSLVSNAPAALRCGERPNTIRVRAETLDDFCSRLSIDEIDVLKIDAEGFDLSVLTGAKGKISDRKVKFIYAEFNRVHALAGASGGALADIAQLLEPLSYQFIASYTDLVLPERESFAVCNALFALPRLGGGL